MKITHFNISKFFFSRKGIQNCEECVRNMMENKGCFDNINAYVLGDKMGKLAFSTGKKISGLKKPAVVFEKFKNYAKEKEKQRTKLLASGQNKVRAFCSRIFFANHCF